MASSTTAKGALYIGKTTTGVDVQGDGIFAGDISVSGSGTFGGTVTATTGTFTYASVDDMVGSQYAADTIAAASMALENLSAMRIASQIVGADTVTASTQIEAAKMVCPVYSTLGYLTALTLQNNSGSAVLNGDGSFTALSTLTGSIAQYAFSYTNAAVTSGTDFVVGTAAVGSTLKNQAGVLPGSIVGITAFRQQTSPAMTAALTVNGATQASVPISFANGSRSASVTGIAFPLVASTDFFGMRWTSASAGATQDASVTVHFRFST